MRLRGSRLQAAFTPLSLSGILQVTGGSLVQFYDGGSFIPNREGTPSSPIVIQHVLSIVDPNNTGTAFPYTTEFYANDVLITAATEGYTLIGTNSLRVEKNIPHGTSVVIKAISKFLDERGANAILYERIDTTYLRTLLKSEAPYQLELSTRGAHFFDGYRNPNRKVDLNAILRKNGEPLDNYTGFTFKWLNSVGKDVEGYELYHDEYINSGRGMVVDLQYIDKEMIRCEAWKDGNLVAFDTVTYIRDFGSLRARQNIPEIPIRPGTTTLTCSLQLFDELGDIEVDAHFIVNWMVVEGSTTRKVGEGAVAEIPVGFINIKQATEIYADVKRREAYAAIVGVDEVGDEVLYVDKEGAAAVTETHGE